MRVLHLYAGNLFGGIETLLTTFARVRHLCPELEPEFGLCFEGRLSFELRDAGVKVHQLGKARIRLPWTTWLPRRRLRRVLAEARSSNTPFTAVITHACWPHALVAPTVRAFGSTLILWCHDYLTPGHWLNRRAAMTRPDLVIANSRHTAQSVPGLFGTTPIEVLYSPVLSRPIDASRRLEVRKAADTAEDAVIIIIACRLEEWKGHSLLLQALGALKQDPRWVCWLVGGSQRSQEVDYLGRLRSQEASLGLSGRIRWLGQRDDVPDLLAAADIHCQPNLAPEPFGIVFIEAMNASLPVVSVRHGGAAEIVDESSGVLIEPGRVDQLAGALARLIDQPALRRRLGGSGPARARLLCDPAAQLAKLKNVIEARRGPRSRSDELAEKSRI